MNKKRTTVRFIDGVLDGVHKYAESRGISVNNAINELVVRSLTADTCKEALNNVYGVDAAQTLYNEAFERGYIDTDITHDVPKNADIEYYRQYQYYKEKGRYPLYNSDGIRLAVDYNGVLLPCAIIDEHGIMTMTQYNKEYGDFEEDMKREQELRNKLIESGVIYE